jgi:hypothetical protein
MRTSQRSGLVASEWEQFHLSECEESETALCMFRALHRFGPEIFDDV